MKPATTASAWATASPLARGIHVDLTETNEPVWFVLVRARREDGTFGLVGSIWVAEDDGDGGFLSIAAGGWMADEMRRSYDSARERGWDPRRIFRYWSDTEVDHPGLELDSPQRVGALSLVRGALARA